MNFEEAQAIRQLEEALALARDQAWAADRPDLMAEGEYFLGQLEQLTQPQENQQALNHFARALALTPENYPVYLSRGGLYLTLEKYPEAIADATLIIENDPDLANAAYGLRGEAYQAQGNFQAAIADFQQAKNLTRVKDNPYVFYDLCLAQLLAGDFTAAQAALAEAQPYLDQPTRDDFVLGFEKEKENYPDQIEGLKTLQAFIQAQNP
jgi:tetratricopeptide (TPR) repeat protein